MNRRFMGPGSALQGFAIGDGVWASFKGAVGALAKVTDIHSNGALTVQMLQDCGAYENGSKVYVDRYEVEPC